MLTYYQLFYNIIITINKYYIVSTIKRPRNPSRSRILPHIPNFDIFNATCIIIYCLKSSSSCPFLMLYLLIIGIYIRSTSSISSWIPATAPFSTSRNSLSSKAFSPFPKRLTQLFQSQRPLVIYMLYGAV